MSVMELEELCQRCGINAHNLDATVRDLKNKEADRINEGGLRDQLPFILMSLGRIISVKKIQELA